MKSSICTGLLSFGMSGKLFQAPFLAAHPGFELHAVVERSEKKAKDQYPAVLSYDSIEDIFADPSIELIVVNTPNYTHFDFAHRALQAGKHVLVEKPFTVTSKEAEILFAEARKNNLHILPYQNRRYDSDFLSVKEVLDQGKLGRLVEVHIRYDRYRYGIGPKVAKETPVPGSGLLYDLGPHMLDMVIALFGEPLEWSKTLGQYRPHTQVDDYAFIHLKYPENLQVYVTMSMLVADVQPAFTLHGTKGSYIKQRSDIQETQLLKSIMPDDPAFGIEDPKNDGLLTTVAEDGTKTQEKIPSVKSSYLNLFEAVYQTIRNGIAYPVTEDQILQQLAILEEK
jgi:scyllo-inositol 2-dehydrogenase (NADP+)